MTKEQPQRLSFRKKMILLINLIFMIVLILVLLITIFFGRIWSDQLVANTDERTQMISQEATDHLDSVSATAQAVMQNRSFLERIQQTTQKITSEEKIQLRRDLQQEIDALRYNNEIIKEIYLLNDRSENQVGFINNEGDIGGGRSLSDVIAQLGDSGKGYWFFSDGLNTALYCQQLFLTDQLPYQRVGVLIAKVDLAFLHEALNASRSKLQGDFFVIRYDGKDYFSDPEKKEMIGRMNDLGGRLVKKDFAGEHYYLGGSQINDIQIGYFIKANNVLGSLILVEAALLCWCIGILLLLMVYTYKDVGMLLRPIERLSQIMSSFHEEGDIKRIEEELRQQTESHQDAETEVLYQSSRHLLERLDKSVLQNYQLELMNQKTELQALQSQLDPHFLYNTLDSIHWLAIKSDEPKIAEMVSSLANLFRKKLNNGGTFSTVADELEVLQSYIKIQKIRFDTRLVYSQEIDPTVLPMKIPKMMIQPLVENAMKYALSQMQETCVIHLSVGRHQDQLEIAVTDNGPGFENTQSVASTKVGLTNIENRLKLLYKDKGRLTIHSEPYDETTVTISIPSDLEVGE